MKYFSLIISALTAWLLVPPVTGPPMVAFFIFFTGLSSLVYFGKKNKTPFDTFIYLGILSLSFFVIYRANEFLQLFDFLLIIFFGSLLISPLLGESRLAHLIFSPFLVIKNTLMTKNMFPYKFSVPEKYKQINYIKDYLPTILLTALVLLITIPLLASANPFFNGLVQSAIKILDAQWLFKYVFSDSFSVYIFRILFFLIFLYIIPRVLTVSAAGTAPGNMPYFFSVNYLIPKIAMSALLIIFFITQAQLYFASSETLQQLGYSNSRLTNEVFMQVTFVAFIVFALVYFDKNRKAWNTRFTYLLIIQAFFLIGIAFKSVYDYTALWGFTQKRLWGYTSMTWLTGAMLVFGYHYYKRTLNIRFFKQILTFTLSVALLVNILNFDYLIYHHSKATLPHGVDYAYLGDLSPDARHYKDELDKLMPLIEKSKSNDFALLGPAYRILERIDYLRHKYGRKIHINSFNIAEYREYLATKDVDVNGHRAKLSEINNAFSPLRPLPTEEIQIPDRYK